MKQKRQVGKSRKQIPFIPNILRLCNTFKHIKRQGRMIQFSLNSVLFDFYQVFWTNAQQEVTWFCHCFSVKPLVCLPVCCHFFLKMAHQILLSLIFFVQLGCQNEENLVEPDLREMSQSDPKMGSLMVFLNLVISFY